jgi:hypothetical protein
MIDEADKLKNLPAEGDADSPIAKLSGLRCVDLIGAGAYGSSLADLIFELKVINCAQIDEAQNRGPASGPDTDETSLFVRWDCHKFRVRDFDGQAALSLNHKRPKSFRTHKCL